MKSFKSFSQPLSEATMGGKDWLNRSSISVLDQLIKDNKKVELGKSGEESVVLKVDDPKLWKQFVDAAKKEGVDHGDMVSRYSMKADELRKREGELQLFEKWLKLFGTRRAKALTDTEERLIDFLK